MAIILTLVIFLMAISIGNSESKDNDNDLVMTLTKENFTAVIAANDYVLVNFYAPWCGHCKALAPEFQKAAKEMMNSKTVIRFAKLDATQNDELAYEQQAFAYPTLKFFRNNSPIKYTGGNEAKDIIAWINKELEPPINQLNTITEVKKFLEEHPIAIIGFFNEQDTEKAATFSTVAAEMKDFNFGLIEKNEIASDLEIPLNSIVLFKPYDGRKSTFDGPNDVEALKRFIQLHSLPLVMEFDHATASKVLRGPTKALLLFFILSEDDQLEKYVKPLSELARAYRDHVLFVTVTYDDRDKKRAFEYFGIMKTETPTMRLIRINEKDELIKYKPDSREISIKTVDDFIQQYIEGCLTHHLLSETLPDDWDEHPVKILVASNFHDVTHDDQRTVLVEFYAPWCGHCKQLEPILEQLAEKYKDNDEIVIAKINGIYNEVQYMKVTAFPTIKLFPKDSDEIISYNGVRTLEGLEEFLLKYGGYSSKRDEL